MGKHEGSWGSGNWMHGGMGSGAGHWIKWIMIGLAIMAIMSNKRMWQSGGMGMHGMMGGPWGMGGRWGMGGPWGMGRHGMMGGYGMMGGHGMMGGYGMKQGMAPWRQFPSAEEKAEKLEMYLEQLRQEEKGVQEKIDWLRSKTGGDTAGSEMGGNI